MTSSIPVIDALLCVALMMDASHLPALMYILLPLFTFTFFMFPFIYFPYMILILILIFSPLRALYRLPHLPHSVLRLRLRLRVDVNCLLLVGFSLSCLLPICAMC